MERGKTAGGKKNRKYGRNKVKCNIYLTRHIREHNKLKRILRSNGLIYAKWWAQNYHVETILDSILKGGIGGRLHKGANPKTRSVVEGLAGVQKAGSPELSGA